MSSFCVFFSPLFSTFFCLARHRLLMQRFMNLWARLSWRGFGGILSQGTEPRHKGWNIDECTRLYSRANGANGSEVHDDSNFVGIKLWITLSIFPRCVDGNSCGQRPSDRTWSRGEESCRPEYRVRSPLSPTLFSSVVHSEGRESSSINACRYLKRRK